jgi:hypothetical protein
VAKPGKGGGGHITARAPSPSAPEPTTPTPETAAPAPPSADLKRYQFAVIVWAIGFAILTLLLLLESVPLLWDLIQLKF